MSRIERIAQDIEETFMQDASVVNPEKLQIRYVNGLGQVEALCLADVMVDYTGYQDIRAEFMKLMMTEEAKPLRALMAKKYAEHNLDELVEVEQ